MTEKRYQLTELQFKLLMEAKAIHQQLEKETTEAKAEVDKILALILDANRIQVASEVHLDPQTKELIISGSND